MNHQTLTVINLVCGGFASLASTIVASQLPPRLIGRTTAKIQAAIKAVFDPIALAVLRLLELAHVRRRVVSVTAYLRASDSISVTKGASVEVIFQWPEEGTDQEKIAALYRMTLQNLERARWLQGELRTEAAERRTGLTSV